MQSKTVKDMMIPLADYATVHQDATLHDAVQALKKAQDEFNQNRYQHRAVLVYNNRDQIVGKLGQLEILRSLEPKYMGLEELDKLALLHVDVDYIRNMMKEYSLWKKPIDDICRNASAMKVKDIMHKPTKGEYVDENESISTAIHQLVMGKQQSLLVTRGKDIVGILRMSDLFKEICDLIDTCEI